MVPHAIAGLDAVTPIPKIFDRILVVDKSSR